MNNINVLAIESSFDDLSVGIIYNNKEYQKSSRASNGPWGGGVPEINARHHSKYIDRLVHELLNEIGITLDDINIFGATVGPGILSGLLVGFEYVKFLAQRLKKPFIPVHHMEAHLLTAKKEINRPSLSLLVSGGHSMIVLDHGNFQYEEICTTIDDAIGEVFDKVARNMGLGFPGGPVIEKIANPDFTEKLTVPVPDKPIFSFSGIKTALIRKIDQYNQADMAALTQNTLTHILVHKIKYFAKKNPKIKELINNHYIEVSGGVAANQFIKNALTKHFPNVNFAPKYLCGDNGIMIARCALLHYQNNISHNIDIFNRMSLESWCALFSNDTFDNIQQI